MSQFLETLVERSWAPLPTEVRPVLPSRFEPVAAHATLDSLESETTSASPVAPMSAVNSLTSPPGWPGREHVTSHAQTAAPMHIGHPPDPVRPAVPMPHFEPHDGEVRDRETTRQPVFAPTPSPVAAARLTPPIVPDDQSLPRQSVAQVPLAESRNLPAPEPGSQFRAFEKRLAELTAVVRHSTRSPAQAPVSASRLTLPIHNAEPDPAATNAPQAGPSVPADTSGFDERLRAVVADLRRLEQAGTVSASHPQIPRFDAASHPPAEPPARTATTAAPSVSPLVLPTPLSIPRIEPVVKPPPERSVTISIGRIEIRGPQPSPAEKTVARTPRPATPSRVLSLDDYLSTRRGGRS